jgi:hypothetical protein
MIDQGGGPGVVGRRVARTCGGRPVATTLVRGWGRRGSTSRLLALGTPGRLHAALLLAAALLMLAARAEMQGPGAVTLPHPVLFVTQVPNPADFTTIGSTFGNHRGSVGSAPRGGDLWIRYPDGTLKNLTGAAGFGTSGFQGPTSIAVREPSVHWDGHKALFSMVVGSYPTQYQGGTFYWQIYEISGLGPLDTPLITRVPNQPLDANNVSPIYGTDDRIIFTSDRPRSGERHLYPQLDEYEEAPTNTGLWSLDPHTGDLFLLQHSPSGSFSPLIDSSGRVVYIRWDHLQRDQQADSDAAGGGGYGTFNYADESPGAARLTDRSEVFPEPRGSRTDLLAGTNLEGHTFNDFFPWQANEDGTEEETLNHLGRHDLHGYFNRSIKDDPNVREFFVSSGRLNQLAINNFLQISEDGTSPGTYYGIDAPEFSTHAAGQIVKLTAPPTTNAEDVRLTYVTHRDTSSYTDTPGPNHSGLYRNPLVLSNGQLIAVHTHETRLDVNTGTRANPGSRYDFRLRTLHASNGHWTADQALTPGISKTITYWDPDVKVTYSGLLWELNPVEVRARPRPARRSPTLETPERQVFAEQGVSVDLLKSYLRQRNLALIVGRDVTTRDINDRQQPFNLRVAGTSTQTLGTAGRIYDVKHLQVVQADQIRGIGGTEHPRPGRRPLAQIMHDPAVQNPVLTNAPGGAVALASDGSFAAFVPARRALSWQLTDPAGTPVVRERYWVTMQAGEIRVCSSCHGANKRDQAGRPPPTNQPEALRQLLQHWKALGDPGSGSFNTLSVSTDGTGSGTVASSPAGVACSTDCGETYPSQTVVTLSATPSLSSVFTGWSGAGCSGVGTCTVSMSTARTVTATFAASGSTRSTSRRYLAEGATGPFFDTHINVSNPGGALASVLLTFLKADATTVLHALSVPPLSQRSVLVDQIPDMQDTAFATVVESEVPVVADRTMTWNGATTVYGSHAEGGLPGPSTTWYLAEGATHSGFDLFYLLLNPGEAPATVLVRYLRPSGEPLERTYTVPARSRYSIWVDREEFPAQSGNRTLSASDVSAVITSLNDVPVIVERAMYWTAGGEIFRAGHDSAGVTTPATRWFLAEGATGTFFDLFILIANPDPRPADVRITYLLADGRTVVKQYSVGESQRYTIWVDQEDPHLTNAAISAIVESTNEVPIVVERSMWWPGPTAAEWTEAHNSPGSTTTGTHWVLADGEVGSAPANTDTYLLVANTSATGATVKVTLLFDDGTPADSRTFTVTGQSRLTVSVRDAFPTAAGRRFGAIVESIGAEPADIVVERAMYSDGTGGRWVAGTNVLATKWP